jgi:hypothetical protein
VSFLVGEQLRGQDCGWESWESWENSGSYSFTDGNPKYKRHRFSIKLRADNSNHIKSIQIN